MTNGSRPALVDSQGRSIPLGVMLGKGGEGTVYEVSNPTRTAAKVYHTPLSDERSAKIRAMVQLRTTELANVTAWPIDLLTLRGSHRPVGLLMPRIENKKNVHHVYGPKSRLKDFPKADWRFLVRTAANIARAFSSVHAANCVIGDVNHGSIMVAEDATVSLIDCDSFQVEANGRRFLCDVGVETFTPPELQGKPFRGALRTPNFDNFGLAVIVFHLLFMGRHPFAGRYSGAGEMPIAKAIKEFRFPYGAQRAAMQMQPPPGTPPLSFVGLGVAQLFERAFSPAAVTGGRPLAREWVAALATLEKSTVQCRVSNSHWYPAGNCPWCEMEGQGAKPLFPFILPPGAATAVMDVEVLWRTLQGLGDPGPAPFLPVPNLPPSPDVQATGPVIKSAKTIAVLVGVAMFVVGLVAKSNLFWLFAIGGWLSYLITLKLLSKQSAVDAAKMRLAAAETAYVAAKEEWERRAGSAVFYEARTRFLNCKAQIDAIPNKRVAALANLKAQQRNRQLEHFLERFEIEDAQIEGIGPGRKRVLESYGIEAADDITEGRLRAVPGFGPKMISRLIQWRRQIEGKFRFDPSQGIDPRDLAKVEQGILAQRVQLQAELRTAYTFATQAHAQVVNTRKSGKASYDQVLVALGQARANLQHLLPT